MREPITQSIGVALAVGVGALQLKLLRIPFRGTSIYDYLSPVVIYFNFDFVFYTLVLRYNYILLHLIYHYKCYLH